MAQRKSRSTAMKRSGETMASPSGAQRSSASTPVTRPVRMSGIGETLAQSALRHAVELAGEQDALGHRRLLSLTEWRTVE